MDDLRSQLMKVGLVTEKQIKQAEKQGRKERKAKRPKKGEAAQDADVARRKQELEQARLQDRERQRAAHETREKVRQEKADAERRASELAERGRSIIKDSGIALSEQADVSYRYADASGTVRTLLVSAEQQRRLSLGELGIARPHANVDRYVLLERGPALQLREACPEKLMLLHEQGEEDDEFAGMMW